ncbi:MAG TPA: hypothetical protein VGN80_14495 [Devosiaceae bacterium]|jgi:hypothetical protein|nr:hypothetical protein [Devosiaceae bacterium]
MIEIAQIGHADPLVFEVTLAGEQRRQRHEVSLSRADHRRHE